MNRWMMLGLATALSLQLAACAPSPAEQAQEAVEEAVDTAAENASGTVETRVEEVSGTVETKAEEVSGTVESAAESVEGTAETAAETLDTVTAWREDGLEALGALGAQAAALEADPTQMTDRGWRNDTEKAIADLQDTVEEAEAASASLEAEGGRPLVRAALDQIVAELDELATAANDALVAEDSAAFLAATGRLATVTTALQNLQNLMDEAGSQ